MQDFHFTTGFSKASVELFLGCASGEHFPRRDAHLPEGRRRKGSETS